MVSAVFSFHINVLRDSGTMTAETAAHGIDRRRLGRVSRYHAVVHIPGLLGGAWRCQISPPENKKAPEESGAWLWFL